MSNEVTAEILTSHLLDLARNGRRIDGRGTDEFRPVHIEPGFVSSADGSALARIGETTVLCGVKLEPVSGVFDSRRQRTAFSNGDRSP